MNFQKVRNYSAVITGFALLLPALASAHVVVTPSQVGIGASQVFDISVPNEKDSAITQLKLEIPAGLQQLTPTAKSGWDITLDKTGSGDSAIVKSVTWTGTIPVGLRDDFSFSAQAPAKPTQLNWKAYQSYADGSTVHWDQKPAGSDDATGDTGPYSVTKIVDDLAVSKPKPLSNSSGNNSLTLIVALGALITAIAAVLRTNNSRK